MEQLQRHTHTESFRYLAETRAILRALEAVTAPKVLVFGCSIGDEVVPLAAARPDAQILAVDIDDDALAAARTLLAPFAQVQVALSDEQAIADAGPFDAILANSVLCRHPEGLTALRLDDLPFELWDELVCALIKNLGVGGVLQVVNSNYRVLAASLANELEAITLPGVQHSGFVPRFAASGEKMVQIQRRRLDDGLDLWCAAGSSVDLRAHLSPMLFVRKGIDALALEARIAEPFRGLEPVGPVSVRYHQPDTDGPEGFVVLPMERRFSAVGRNGVAQFFADELVVGGESIGTKLTRL